MKSLADKLATLLPKLQEHGSIYLFALFARDDAAGKWDVVFSSEWSNSDAASAVRTISDMIVPMLGSEELAALSRVVIIPSKEPGVALLASGMSGCAELVNCNFMGLQIGHAFIFRAQRPPAAQPAATAA